MLTSDSVDPADVLVPALILQVQMTYLCKEDCKGLCPHCGADRNVTDCDCDKSRSIRDLPRCAPCSIPTRANEFVLKNKTIE